MYIHSLTFSYIFSFADEAKNIKTIPLCNNSIDSITERVQGDITRLVRLKADLEPLLQNTGKIDEEIADLESILVMEKGMKPRRQLVKRELGQVLKIRPFFASMIGLDKKYQIGEMKDKSIDAQSR